MPLDADERELLESVERGEWRSTRGFARQQTEYARALVAERLRGARGVAGSDLGTDDVMRLTRGDE